MSYQETNKERVRRIQEAGDILQLLAYYGYEIHSEYHTEQQYSCDLHGDGSDNSPSARVYPDTNSTYCFACRKSRNLVDFYMEKSGESFANACYALEKEYGLSHLYYEQEPDLVIPNFDVRDFDLEKRDTSRVLRETQDSGYRADSHDLTVAEYSRFWEVYDMVCWYVREERWSESQAAKALVKLRRKFREVMTSRLQCST